jgi:hypothetical protein
MKSKRDLLILGSLALVVFILVWISCTVKPYGFFIDEVYFMSCAKHLAFGYIDQPPLSILLLALVRDLLGSSLILVRILPALSIASTAFIAGLIAKRLGGSIGSMLLALLAVAAMPVFMVFGSYFSMNAYEPLIWTAAVYFVIRMVQEEDPRYWIHFGVLMGLGLEMKHTIVLYGAALIFGLLISRKRNLLFNRWILWGGLACFLLILPNLIWQYVHHFPSLELYANSFSSKNINKSYLQVMIEQIIFVNPASFPLWIAGLFILLSKKFRAYRFMLYTYAILLFMLVLGHSSRPDRITSVYPFLFAMGAVGLEHWLPAIRFRTVQVSMAALIIVGGLLLAPIFCPILPPEQLGKYIARLGLHFDIEEGKKGEPLPQWLADRIGWEEMAEKVAEVYNALPEDEKRNAAIVSTNYGEAGALDLYGPEYGLPIVYCTHNSFHTWGPPSDTIKTYIGVYINADDVKDKFEQVEEAAVYHCPDCTRPQREVSIYILRKPTISIESEWEHFKNYN